MCAQKRKLEYYVATSLQQEKGQSCSSAGQKTELSPRYVGVLHVS